MRSFCINLDRRQDRWIRAQKALKAAGFTDVERVSAVDGTKLNLSQITKWVSTRGRVELLEPRRNFESLVGLGAVGCALSHICLWKRLIEDKAHDEYAIFEDDVAFSSPDLSDALENALAQIRPFDVFLIGYLHLMCDTSDFSSGLWRFHGRFFGTHAYVVSRRGAQRLLAHALPIEVQVDSYIGFMAMLDPEFLLLGFEKSKCSQDLGRTDIQHFECLHCWAPKHHHLKQTLLNPNATANTENTENTENSTANSTTASISAAKKPLAIRRAFHLHTRALLIGVSVAIALLVILLLIFLPLFVHCRATK
jgi:GR25 family glycosyltransferase involved in LPS biosynthesis